MLVKQFRTGYEAKTYLLALKKFYDEENKKRFESFETRGVEYGYILNEATKAIGEIEKVDYKELVERKIVFPKEIKLYLLENEEKLKGGTIKFKLSEDASIKIDQVTQYLSENWNMRLYRAYSVKILLKLLYLIKIENK
ncbi:hypothetical protein [Bacillus kwashiorkori]|uniref:hypothetical protein n=1 Tax=Bacillus kwashiorkori TaxID=1522318 RepID=UPI0007864D13|nr:hypothetical protein [Bacillus kwashiorkori]